MTSKSKQPFASLPATQLPSITIWVQMAHPRGEDRSLLSGYLKSLHPISGLLSGQSPHIPPWK